MAKKDKKLAENKKTKINYSNAYSKKEKKNIFRNVFDYFKQLKNELKKVVWPSKKKVFGGTMIVIVTVVVVSLFVVAADFAFHNLLKLLLGSL